jgi:hypothetical protein
LNGKLPVTPAGDSVRAAGTAVAVEAVCSRTVGATGGGAGVAISGVCCRVTSGVRDAAISGVTIGFGAVIAASRAGLGVAGSIDAGSAVTAGAGADRGASTGTDKIAGVTGTDALAATIGAGADAAGRGGEPEAASWPFWFSASSSSKSKTTAPFWCSVPGVAVVVAAPASLRRRRRPPRRPRRRARELSPASSALAAPFGCSGTGVVTGDDGMVAAARVGTAAASPSRRSGLGF